MNCGNNPKYAISTSDPDDLSISKYPAGVPSRYACGAQKVVLGRHGVRTDCARSHEQRVMDGFRCLAS